MKRRDDERHDAEHRIAKQRRHQDTGLAQHGLQAGVACQRDGGELDRHIAQIERVADGDEADDQQPLHLVRRQPKRRFFHWSIFRAKWNPVSREKMRLTIICAHSAECAQGEYGRECGAGQPGAGSEHTNFAKTHESLLTSYWKQKL